MDFNTTTGRTSWWGAQAWITYLNVTKYQGYADWRLPTIPDALSSHHAIGTSPGFTPPTTGELTQLFYVEMGADENAPNFLSSLNSNAATFDNLQIHYWYGTETLFVSPTGAWSFGVANGADPKVKFGAPLLATPFPMRSGQASLVDMLKSIQTSAMTSDIKKPKPVDLTVANALLMASCDALKFYSTQARSPGNVSTTTSILAADTEALEAVIGCK